MIIIDDDINYKYNIHNVEIIYLFDLLFINITIVFMKSSLFSFVLAYQLENT